MANKLTREQILTQLKAEGINSLDDLATYVQKVAKGQTTVEAAIINPHYFVTH